jgi:hypothetical protein
VRGGSRAGHGGGSHGARGPRATAFAGRKRRCWLRCHDAGMGGVESDPATTRSCAQSDRGASVVCTDFGVYLPRPRWPRRLLLRLLLPSPCDRLSPSKGRGRLARVCRAWDGAVIAAAAAITVQNRRRFMADTPWRGCVKERRSGSWQPGKDEKPRESVGAAVTRTAPGVESWRPVEHLTRSVRATRSAVIRTTYGFLQGKSSLRERCGMRSPHGFAPLTGSRITLTMSSSPVPIARSVQSS